MNRAGQPGACALECARATRFGEFARLRLGERGAASGQARIAHEIILGAENLLIRRRDDALACSILQNRPALGIVEQIGEQDLLKYLLVQRRVEDSKQGFDTAVEIARHQVGRGNID